MRLDDLIHLMWENKLGLENTISEPILLILFVLMKDRLFGSFNGSLERALETYCVCKRMLKNSREWLLLRWRLFFVHVMWRVAISEVTLWRRSSSLWKGKHHDANALMTTWSEYLRTSGCAFKVAAFSRRGARLAHDRQFSAGLCAFTLGHRE
jgi:hypothetical protein